MSRMAELYSSCQDAYAYLTSSAPWWPAVDTLEGDDHVRYIGGMLIGYVDAVLWSSEEDDADPALGELRSGPLAPGEWPAAAALCASFYLHNARDLKGYAPWANDAEQAGHDLALTRNRHGAGYWDRNYPRTTPAARAGARLTDAAHALGETYPYRGDDGNVYGVADAVPFVSLADELAARTTRGAIVRGGAS
jgi:hypothetical protein